MIDLHCHILPDIDDGARSMEDSLAMAEAAVAEGITHILATPHHMNGKFENRKSEIILAVDALQEKLDAHSIDLTIYPGQEVRLYGEFLEDVKKDEILFTDEGNHYVLIEFPTMSIPHFAESFFFQIQQHGITPVIVHPERNQEIIDNPNKLLEFVERGVLAQVTASSYVGVFGKKVAELSHQLIEANLVHILASDAHNTRGRSFNMHEAYIKLEDEFGTKKARAFKQNAKDMINGDYFQADAPSEVRKKKRLFGLF